MFIATLTRVKSRLEIPEAYEKDDKDLSALIEGVEDEVLLATGLDLSAKTRTETNLNVQRGTAIHTRFRPVASITSARWRSSGNSTWTTIDLDLLDAEEGTVYVPGEYGQTTWPPKTGPAPWYRWRNAYLSVLEITYLTAGKVLDQDFIEAVVGLCAYRWRRERAGAAQSSSIGGASESLLEDDVPSWIKSQLAPYIREEALWCP